MIILSAISNFILSCLAIVRAYLPICQESIDLPINICYINSLLITFFTIASFGWTACITHSTGRTINLLFQDDNNATSNIKGFSSMQQEANYMFRYHVFCWYSLIKLPSIKLPSYSLTHSLTYLLRSCSILFTVIIPLTNAAGGPSCWIVTSSASSSSSLPYIGALIIYLVPLIAVQFYHSYVLYFLMKTLKQIPSVLTHSLTHLLTYSLTHSQVAVHFRRCNRYLLVIIVTKTILIIDRMLLLHEPDMSKLPFYLQLIMLLALPMQVIASLTCSLTHCLTHSLTHSLTHRVLATSLYTTMASFATYIISQV